MVGETCAGETALSARSEILANVRRAVGENASSCDAEYAAIARDYRRSGQLATEDIVRLLEGRLRDYDAGVFHCGADAIAQTVAQAMVSRGKSSLLRPADVPDMWLPSTHQFPVVNGMSYEEIDRAEGVITGCVAAIAFTGTIILRHSEGDGRRALTLIPDYHLCIVHTSQVVETVPEGFARLKGMETMPITTVSGPSATADIEMNRVKGVHGPRFLDIVLVG